MNDKWIYANSYFSFCLTKVERVVEAVVGVGLRPNLLLLPPFGSPVLEPDLKCKNTC